MKDFPKKTHDHISSSKTLGREGKWEGGGGH